jgi:creatinine amidohydrolase/Fe(II)-dependent formamide hydrolase-like protein
MPDATEVKRAILDWGVTWGWDSGDRRIADRGVTGDARAATAEFGNEVIRRTLANVGPVLQRLRENGAR